MPRARKRLLAIVSAVCGVVALGVAVPAAHATVGGKCKLETPTTPVAGRDGYGYLVIKSSAVMWCEEDAQVEFAKNTLVHRDTGTSSGPMYDFMAKAGWRYVLEVQMPCSYNREYNVQGSASFWGPEGLVYNTSGWRTVVCR